MANVKMFGPVEAESTTADNEIPTKERKADKTPDRRHANVLLDISEENFIQEMEPHEYHCYDGWEEAACGWTRVDPYASILMAQKTDQKPKRKDPEHDSATSVEPDNLADQPRKSPLGPPNRSLKSVLTRHCTSSHQSNPSPDTPETVDGMSKTMAQFVLEDQTEDTRTPFQHHQVSSKYNEMDNRPLKKKSQRTSNEVLVPVKNITFLPPINMPHHKQQNSNGKKHPQGETTMENLFTIDKIDLSRIRGTKCDLVYNPELLKDTYTEALSSKYRTCQHNLHFYSGVGVSVPKRYHVAVSSKPEILHPTGYSMSKTLHSTTPAACILKPD